MNFIVAGWYACLCTLHYTSSWRHRPYSERVTFPLVSNSDLYCMLCGDNIMKKKHGGVNYIYVNFVLSWLKFCLDMNLSAFFRNITRRRVVIVYRSFGITYRSRLQGSRVRDSWSSKMGPIRCPETSVNNHHRRPRNIPEERISRQYRSGSLKSRLYRYVSREVLDVMVSVINFEVI
jgi:hypothetical protein